MSSSARGVVDNVVASNRMAIHGCALPSIATRSRTRRWLALIWNRTFDNRRYDADEEGAPRERGSESVVLGQHDRENSGHERLFVCVLDIGLLIQVDFPKEPLALKLE